MGAKDTFLLSPVDERAPIQQLDFLLEILGNSVLWLGGAFLGVRVVGIFFIHQKFGSQPLRTTGGGKKRRWVFSEVRRLPSYPRAVGQ
jgi:hypothetical protein